MPVMDPADIELANKLHETYEKNTWDLVVGAGASIASGSPSWNELNSRLLCSFFKDMTQGLLKFQPSDLNIASDIFISRFGREAVVDLVRKKLRKKRLAAADAKGRELASRELDLPYYELLRSVLYDVPAKGVSGIHLELAAWTLAQRRGPKQDHVVYTFNFDNFLEQAIELLRPEAGKVHSIYDQESMELPLPPEVPRVIHLHGFIPPDGNGARPAGRAPGTRSGALPIKGTLVLSEEDYFTSYNEDSWDWMVAQNNRLFLQKRERDFRPTTILVGLSMTDALLREVLLHRKGLVVHPKRDDEAPKEDRLPPKMCILLDRPAAASTSELIERAAHQVVRKFEREFWENWHIDTLLAERALIPFYLRQVRLGRDGAAWLEKARCVLETSPVYPRLYDMGVQEKLSDTQALYSAWLRRHFPIPSDELLHIGGFVPARRDIATTKRLRGSLIQAFRYREPIPSYREDGTPPWNGRPGGGGRDVSGVLSAKEGAERHFSVASLDEPEGVIGRAYVWGCEVEASREQILADPSVQGAESAKWTRERNFASLLCVPVIDSRDWLPVGVMLIASNKREAFWKALDALAYDELRTALRSFFQSLFQYDGAITFHQKEQGRCAGPNGRKRKASSS